MNLGERVIVNALTETESISAGSLDRNGDSIHRGDTIDYRQPMFWRQMAIASGHRNCLVAGEFLDLFDRCAGHGQPGAECVPV